MLLYFVFCMLGGFHVMTEDSKIWSRVLRGSALGAGEAQQQL
jgi:hypothetical protein